MALRIILREGDPALRKRCRPVTDFSARTADLLDDLRETLIDAQGAGLAAPQVGILRRAVVIAKDGELIDLVNPEIIKSSEEVEGEYEGCLSLPGVRGFLLRPKYVTVRAQDRGGEWFELACENIAARAVCHELDHLDGKLFVDFVDERLTEEEVEAILSEQAEDDGEK